MTAARPSSARSPRAHAASRGSEPFNTADAVARCAFTNLKVSSGNTGSSTSAASWKSSAVCGAIDETFRPSASRDHDQP